MIKRFRILAEKTDRRVPEVGEVAVFKVVAIDQPSPSVLKLHVFVTAVDPTWGPGFIRVEGFVRNGHDTQTVIGYHASRMTDDNYIGRIEVHLDET